ncbi:MAG: hypothetical protein ABIH82_03085 [Candidatus Woesearchaeota archaeon]
MRNKLIPVAEVLHALADGKEVEQGRLEVALANVDLRVGNNVLYNLRIGYYQSAGILAMFTNSEGVVDTTVNVTGDSWSPIQASINMGAYYGTLHRVRYRKGSFAGLCNMMREEAYQVTHSGPFEERHQAPLPHYLTAALAKSGGDSDPLVFTTAESGGVIKTRAFIPAFSRMGGIVDPNSRADILYHNGITLDSKIDRLAEKLAGTINVVRAVDNPCFRGGFFNIEYQIV